LCIFWDLSKGSPDLMTGSVKDTHEVHRKWAHTLRVLKSECTRPQKEQNYRHHYRLSCCAQRNCINTSGFTLTPRANTVSQGVLTLSVLRCNIQVLTFHANGESWTQEIKVQNFFHVGVQISGCGKAQVTRVQSWQSRD
jgi:hypothetical protein